MNATKVLFFSMFLLFTAVSVQANENMTVDEKVQKLQKELNLTNEQTEQVRPIVQEFKTKMEKLHQEKEDKLDDILNPEQMNKFREWKAKHDKK